MENKSLNAKGFYSAKHRKTSALASGELLTRRISKSLELVCSQKPKIFLDIGCGNGSFALEVHKITGARVFGVDIVKASVERARKLGVNAKVADVGLEKLPFKDAYFDTVFCGEIIEHLYDTDYLLSECRRVLKKGGALVITTPNLASWLNRLLLLAGFQPHLSEVSVRHNVGKAFADRSSTSGHIHMFTPSALKELLEINGFEKAMLYGYKGFGKKEFPLNIPDFFLSAMPQLSAGIIAVARKK